MSVFMRSLEQPYSWKDLRVQIFLAYLKSPSNPSFDLGWYFLYHSDKEVNTIILNKIFVNIYLNDRIDVKWSGIY